MISAFSIISKEAKLQVKDILPSQGQGIIIQYAQHHCYWCSSDVRIGGQIKKNKCTRTYGSEATVQRQWPPTAVMKLLSFPVHLCSTWAAIVHLTGGIVSWIFDTLFITAVSITHQNTRAISCICDDIIMSLQWCHNESDGISNHWRLDCLLNRLFWCRSKKISFSSLSLAFVRAIHRWPVNSLHKGPVTQKMFPWWFWWLSVWKSIVFIMKTKGFSSVLLLHWPH